MTVTKDEILKSSTFLRLVEFQFKEWETIIDRELRKRYREGEVVYFYFNELPCLTSSRDILEKARELVIERYQACGWKVHTGINTVKGGYFATS